ncbi:MAG TPA: glycosyltransferase family 4 protein [Roseiflexaceae bacterium]|nr:glycosyltransferase family 4 protein [Roseiflexaceae bacterium]HMP40888.1 glycosyltransferase family 4 protein [Roseiflexaceae bacterium]
MSEPSTRMLMLVPALDIGGADKVNIDLATQLVGRFAAEVYVLATLPAEYRLADEYRARVTELILMPQLVPVAEQPQFVVEIIRSRRIDTVLIANSEFGYRALAFLRHHCPAITFIDYLHAVDAHWRNGGYPRMSLEQAHWLDLSITSSESLRNWLLERGGTPQLVHVCTTNIDPQKWDPAHYDRPALRAALGITDATPIILSIGRLVVIKQPRLLARLMAYLEHQHHRFVCLVVGDGPERAWLETFVRRQRLRSLRLLGSTTSRHVRELFAAADLLILPSRGEGIALVLFEALAMGLPVVSADVGGQRELVTPECGILVQHGPGEEAAYRRALTELLADPVRRRAMGQAGRERIVTHFRLDQMGDRMYELLVEARRRRMVDPRPVPDPGLAAASRAAAIDLAHEEHTARRLLAADPANGGTPTEQLLRRGRRMLRPLYRATADRFPQIIPAVLRVRYWLLRRLYRQET